MKPMNLLCLDESYLAKKKCGPVLLLTDSRLIPTLLLSSRTQTTVRRRTQMKSIQFKKRVLALAAGFVIAAGTYSTFGQNANSGEIKGTVTDSSNAVIPEANVSIANLATGAILT